MNIRLLSLSCLSALAVALAAAPHSLRAAPAANPAGFAIRRGVNLSHWLSQDFRQFDRSTFITENDLRYIASLGYDHVRLPVDEQELWSDNGAPIEPAFALMEDAINWARKHGLRVVVDLHIIRSHHFNAGNEGMKKNTLWSDPKAQEQFLDLWRQLSARLRHHPVDQVAYEPMNEPVADDHEDWNRLVASAIKTLRALEPNRVLVIGSNKWQGPGTMPFLKVPAGDKNIILSTHTYQPMMLTHYGASWTPLKAYKGPVTYPGKTIPAAELEQLLASPDEGLRNNSRHAAEEWNRARLLQELAPAIKRAKELGLQLYCGEFGCLPTVPRAARLAYYRDMVAVLGENDVAWANWEYKCDFGLFEWHPGKQPALGAPDLDMIDALLGR